MKKTYIITLIVVGTLFLLFGFSFLVPIIDRDNSTSDRVLIKAPEGLTVQDFCILNDDLYVLYWGSHKVYKLVNDIVIDQWNDYEASNIKFDSPSKIKPYKDVLLIGDYDNLRVHAIDTSGKYLGRYPKQSPVKRSWSSIAGRDASLSDFFIDDEYFGLCYSKGNEDVVSVYNKTRQETTIFDSSFSSITAVDFDKVTKTIFIADAGNRTIYAYSINGEYLNSVGEYGEIEYPFEVLLDMNLFEGKLYVLDAGMSKSPEENGYGLIHVFDSSLSFEAVIGEDESLYFPQAFDFDKNGREIVVMCTYRNVLRRIENTLIRD